MELFCLWINTCICVWVSVCSACVCVCVWGWVSERQRERERQKESPEDWQLQQSLHAGLNARLVQSGSGSSGCCSLLALNDSNTRYCISQLLQRLGWPLVTPATVWAPHLLQHWPVVPLICFYLHKVLQYKSFKDFFLFLFHWYSNPIVDISKIGRK